MFGAGPKREMFETAAERPCNHALVSKAPRTLEVRGRMMKGDMRSLVRAGISWLSVGSERGVTAIEYGLIAALIAIAIIVGVTAVGTNS